MVLQEGFKNYDTCYWDNIDKGKYFEIFSIQMS